MTEHYFWEAITILIPIVLGGFFTIVIYAYHQKQDKDTRISDMKKAVKQEIQENMDEIKDYKITTKTEEVKIKTSKIKYLTIASFDSSVNSGDFVLLSAELRKEISELYTYIFIANFESEQLIKSQYIMAEDNDRFERLVQRQLDALTEMYQTITTKSENILKKL